MSIFERLRADHDKQRAIISDIIDTQGDSQKRSKLFFELKHQLEHHALAEERHFYVPLMQHDMTQEKSRHSIAEHHQLDKLIEELEKTEYSSPGWLVTAKKLSDKLLHHLEEEEREIFQLAGRVLSDKEKSQLGEDYIDEMDMLKAA